MEPNLNTNFNHVTSFLYTQDFIYTRDMYILLCFGNAGLKSGFCGLWKCHTPNLLYNIVCTNFIQKQNFMVGNFLLVSR